MTLDASRAHHARGRRRPGCGGGRRGHTRAEGHGRGGGGGRRHHPQIHVVVGVAFRDEGHERAIGRHARIGLVVERVGQRHRRLPRRRSRHRLHDLQVPLRAGIHAHAARARRPAGKHDAAIRRERRPALVAGLARDRRDGAVAQPRHVEVKTRAAIGRKRHARAVGREHRVALHPRRRPGHERGRVRAVGRHRPDRVERRHGHPSAVGRPHRILGADHRRCGRLRRHARATGARRRQHCGRDDHRRASPGHAAITAVNHLLRTASAIFRADRP